MIGRAAWMALAAGLLAAANGAAAHAQNVPEGGDGLLAATLAPPAEQLAVTPGGVDMRTGRYNFSQTDLSIGEDNEAGGLALTRGLGTDGLGHINPFGNFSHNFDIFIDFQLVPVGTSGSTQVDRARVHFGGRSETFEWTGPGYWQQVSRSGYARLTTAGTVHTFTSNDGTVAVFRPTSGTNTYCSTMLGCANVATVTYADGTRFTFDYDTPASPAPARLRKVTSNRGYALLFQYDDQGSVAHQIVSACLINLSIAPAPANGNCPQSPLASASYAYVQMSGQIFWLAGATDAGGATSSYAYTGSPTSYTMAFTRPGETGPWLTNTVDVRQTESSADHIVYQQTFADGATYGYSYDYSPEVLGEIPQLAGGSYTDPGGHQITVRYDFPIRPGSTWGNVQTSPEDPQTLFYQITPGPVEIIDALGRRSTTDYCDPQAMLNLPSWEHHRCLVMPTPVSFTSPTGIRTDLIWDWPMRLLLRSTQRARPGTTPAMDDIVRSATYNCGPTTMAICTRPITRTDANGNVTNYSYDTTHGGLLAETGPAPSAGAPRPQIRHEYAQRHAWLANGAGGYAQSGPIWVRTATSVCRTSAATGNPAAPCATAGDEVRTLYDYGPDSGPNTLLLRGQTVTATDGGVATTLRTCYGYDARGRRISETQPNANLSSCP